MDKLLIYQKEHVNKLINIIKNNNSALDGSDTGTGKTYTSIAVCKILNLKPIIICPKAVISSWTKVLKIFNVEALFIVNYETIKSFKYYDKNQNRITCPYIVHNLKNENKSKIIQNDEFSPYKWNVQNENCIFIFDEVHRASSSKSLNGKLLFSAKLTNKPILILSATIADTTVKFNLFSWILNFSKDTDMPYYSYIDMLKYAFIVYLNSMHDIFRMLYPSRASRMKITELGDLFPETQIIAEPYTLGKTREQEIQKYYNIIEDELSSLQDKMIKDKTTYLVRIIRAHQKIELLKIPIFVEIAENLIKEKYKLVIFVNFTQTLNALGQILNCNTFIHGKQTLEERDNAISLFNENKINIIICNIKAGGVGISLHDIYGNNPRASLISPPWSSVDLVQALGRIHRSGGKSKSIQRIIYTANTIEERIAEKLKDKLDNLNEINNGGIKDMLNSIITK